MTKIMDKNHTLIKYLMNMLQQLCDNKLSESGSLFYLSCYYFLYSYTIYDDQF